MGDHAHHHHHHSMEDSTTQSPISDHQHIDHSAHMDHENTGGQNMVHHMMSMAVRLIEFKIELKYFKKFIFSSTAATTKPFYFQNGQ